MYYDLLKVSEEPRLQQTLCLLLHLLEYFIQALDAQLITQVKTEQKTKTNPKKTNQQNPTTTTQKTNHKLPAKPTKPIPL